MPDPRFDKEKRRKGIRSGRVDGDLIYYTILHNTISLIMFFAITYSMDLYSRRTQVIMDIFVQDFLDLIVMVFFLSIMLGLFARLVSFVILHQIFVVWRKREMKKIGELNRGINKIGLSWLISILIGSIFFSIGVLYILQMVLFGYESFLALLISYAIMKGGVYLLVKLFSNFSL